MQKSVAFYTLGCKVNQAESRRLTDALRDDGWQEVDSRECASVYVVNSCAVTAESARKTRQAVRRFKKNNPEATIALIGCMPSITPNLGEKLPEADIILPQAEKDTLPQKLRELAMHTKENPPLPTAYSRSPAVRAAVKIQDGCDRFCSYCVIPLARGKAKSVPVEEILDECKSLLARGVREIILTGINLCSWGKEFGLDIGDIACQVGNLDGLLRLRLGSLEPDLLSRELLIKLSDTEKLCPHFHLSLQSGSDSVLKRMNRRYDTAHYRELCQMLRTIFPNPTITTDIITGFPGETEDEFAQSLAFAREIAFADVHVFPYSPRNGTKAAAMPGQLPKSLKEARAKLMIAETQKIRKAYLASQADKTMEVLIEEQDAEGFWRGYSVNYLPVRFKGEGAVGQLRILDTGYRLQG
ncbi:MAG: tRNA (N(6)-L-threonylcarbamoyladenosine(37)-C(2))-methylthiotransferase MtaB [Oscillospiraceae bacterium]|nr:tRNA (N(6)-L-threonylcarbamoyladenosine(37)-C(2))-methylthiotransferase MtaB [Oscillospiraceae bacterium]